METMYVGKVNSPATTLDGGINDVVTTIDVVDGSVLPNAPNLAVIGTGEDAETILYGTKIANQLTSVTREFQGTAKAWDSGTATSRLFTAYDYDSLKSNITELAGRKLSAFAATTSAELAGVISDKTGSGKLVFGTAPTLSDVHTDIWLEQDSNTFFGVGVVGAGNLEHTTGNEGYYNTFLGNKAGYNITTGYSNTFLGNLAGYSNTNGAYNFFLGYASGFNNLGGSYNYFFGTSAGYTNTTGGYNIFIGNRAGFTNLSGGWNTFLGYNAGYTNSTGNFSVFLGYKAGYNETGSHKLYVDSSDTATPLIYGEFDNDLVRIYGKLSATVLTQTVVTMGDTDLTPDVSAGNIFISQENTGATAITDLDNPTVGQIVTIICGHATNAPTIADGGNFKMSAAWNSTLDDSITFFVKADNYYIELSRSVN